MQFVKYIGRAHRRMITADEFRRAGYPNTDSVSWDYRNGFSVPADRFSDEVLKGVIQPDPHLVIVGGDDNAPKDLVTRQTPAQAAAPRVDVNAAVQGSTVPSGASSDGPVTTGTGSGTSD